MKNEEEKQQQKRNKWKKEGVLEVRHRNAERYRSKVKDSEEEEEWSLCYTVNKHWSPHWMFYTTTDLLNGLFILNNLFQ